MKLLLTFVTLGIIAIVAGVGIHYIATPSVIPTQQAAIQPSANTATTQSNPVAKTPPVTTPKPPAMTASVKDCGISGTSEEDGTVNKCFDDKFALCQPAKVSSFGITYYEIKGEINGECRLYQKLLQVPKESTWGGKDMTCTVNNKLGFDVAYQPSNMTHCSGPLYDVWIKPTSSGYGQ